MSRPPKKRHWAFILYPESAPADWRETIEKTGLKAAISPIHDRDVTKDGNLKKEHYHIIVSYNGPVTYENAKSLTDSLGQPIPQIVENVDGYYRYLWHDEAQNKAVYSEKDVILLNGFKAPAKTCNGSEYDEQMIQLIQYIKEHQIKEFSELCDCLLEDGLFDLLMQLRSSSFFYSKILDSIRFKNTKKEVQENEM